MRLDYHMHTPLCKHAVGEPEAYVERALALGLDEIGFSDHGPMPPDYDPNFRMGLGELPGYVERIRSLQSKYPRLSIKLGLEADYHPGTEEFVRETTRAYAFDYVIGSVHYIGDWGFDNPENIRRYRGADLYEVYRQYFDLVAQCAESGLYDILGHPDVIKKFGHRPERPFEDLLGRALEAVRRAGMAVEVNTSGLRKPCREIYPSRRFLELARERDVPVTMGSDAHEPRHVGEDFEAAAALLTSVGYRTVLRFAGRRAEPVPL